MIHPRYIPSHILEYHPTATTIAIYLDYNCPFSAKMFKKIQDEVIPKLKKDNIYTKVNLVFMNVIQPWHGIQSSICHDVSFAVAKIKPTYFWKFSRVLFDEITMFYDNVIYDKTRGEITDMVIQLFAKMEGVSSRDVEQVKELVIVKGVGEDKADNTGNKVAVDNKYFTRYHRTIGIHVTPSIVINGIYMPLIESSTDSDKIVDIIKSNI